MADPVRGVVDNFPVRPARPFLRLVLLPLGARRRPAADHLGRRIVQPVLAPGEQRDRLTREIFVSHDPADPTGILEHTLKKVVEAEDALKRIERAVRKGEIRRYHGRDWIGEAVERGVVTAAEAPLLREVEDLTGRVIAVDHFDPEEVRPHYRVVTNASRPAASDAAE